MSSLLVISIFAQLVVLPSTFCQMPTKLSMGGNIGVAVGPGAKVGVRVSVVVGNENVGRDVLVGIAGCGSAKAVLMVAMAVSILSA